MDDESCCMMSRVVARASAQPGEDDVLHGDGVHCRAISQGYHAPDSSQPEGDQQQQQQLRKLHVINFIAAFNLPPSPPPPISSFSHGVARSGTGFFADLTKIYRYLAKTHGNFKF
jgi:hypothetical protein